MPRTRHHLGRAEKVAQLVDAAVSQMTAGGYEALSVASIARRVGVAQNAVYWYFPSKDHLFVAALAKMVGQVLEEKPRTGSVVDDVLAIVERLDTSHGLLTSLYVRAKAAPVVAEFEASLRASMQGLLRAAIGMKEPGRDGPEIATALLCTIEGALLLGLPPAERDAVIRLAFDSLVARHATER